MERLRVSLSGAVCLTLPVTVCEILLNIVRGVGLPGIVARPKPIFENPLFKISFLENYDREQEYYANIRKTVQKGQTEIAVLQRQMVYGLPFDVKELQIWKYIIEYFSNPFQGLTL